MKTDARKALFGGFHQYLSLTSEQVRVHPHHAALYLLTVDPGETATVILPGYGARHLRTGLCLSIVVGGLVTDGDVVIADDDSSPIVFLATVAPGYIAECYITEIDEDGLPTWAIYTKALGASSLL